MRRRERKSIAAAGLCAAAILCPGPGAPPAVASQQVPQTAVPGSCIPQFALPLAVFGPAGAIPRVDAGKHQSLTVRMREVDQDVLTGLSDTCGLGLTFGKTRVWGYEISNTATGRLYAPARWPAVTIEAKRHGPVRMKYVNDLPAFNAVDRFGLTGLLQGIVTVDKTIDFPPLFASGQMMGPCTDTAAGVDPFGQSCADAYLLPPPAVPHLHGAEVPSKFDGGPEAWFTSDGRKGAGFRSKTNLGPGKALYEYNNAQEPGTLWFHDHAMGATRTNVYSGLAAFYFVRDPANEPQNLPGGPQEIEMAIQDRQFDTTGQLYFPDGTGADAAVSNLNGTPGNPGIHPFWIPEFAGDIAVVNGVPWPYFSVEPRRYRFRILEGSNARFYNLRFVDGQGTPLPVYQIGSDGNYLDAPVAIDALFLAPGERADILVDFTSFAGGTVTVTNDAVVPYPAGLSPVPSTDPVSGVVTPADQPQMAQIMRFNVSATPVADTSCDPAAGGCIRPKPMVRLTDGNGAVAAGVVIDQKRQLVLKEVMGPGGPIKVLVNNTNYFGGFSPGIAADFPTDGVSELPRQGSTELWEIINLTADAHPMHTHLTQFQILNRESFSAAYPVLWESAFPAATGFDPSCTGGVVCPGYGPPLPYGVANADGAIGGNPAVGPYLLGDVTPPGPGESGWKDTAKAFPGQVLRILVRYTPTSKPVKPNVSYAGRNFYPFDPTAGPGYVWHCHIVDHEDNDMMRPFKVAK